MSGNGRRVTALAMTMVLLVASLFIGNATVSAEASAMVESGLIGGRY